MLLLVLSQILFSVQVEKAPDTHRGDTLYVSGNFNQWNPADTNFILEKRRDGTWYLERVLDDIPSDRLEYKFTRGTWAKSESTKKGNLTGPRTAVLGEEIRAITEIEGWRDDFPTSTLSANVQILDSAFYMPQLGKKRKISVYLPADYAQSQQMYPVLYMPDGQHLFDEATSQGRIGPIEWGIDEFLDQQKESFIVVAIDHPRDFDEREQELYVFPNERFPEVSGREFLDFIVNTLKPSIDKKFRTRPGSTHTGILGSSLGGLSSLYGGLLYPETFGLVGVFSPSVWLDEGQIQLFIQQLEVKKAHSQQHYYFYAGEQELRRKPDGSFVAMHLDVMNIVGHIENRINPGLRTEYKQNGRHGALHWREAFPSFYQWFIALNKNN